MRRQAFYLDAPGGGRFCLVSWPAGVPVGGILYIHPFAEEMNKSRRMAALGARAFVERGWVVVQMDLYGCGDSAGDLGLASWAAWLDDISHAWAWLRGQCPAPAVLWTTRGGSLLAADWLAACNDLSPPLLMWQPVISGKQHLTQFLRLKAAGEMLVDADAQAAMAAVRADLLAGFPVEVAGYELTPALASGMEASSLRLPERYRGRLGMFEVCGGERVEISPALGNLHQRLKVSGVDADVDAVRGAAFWQTQEIETVPALIERSTAWLDQRLS